MCQGLLEESDGEAEPEGPLQEPGEPSDGGAETAPVRSAPGERKTEQQRRREKAARILVRPCRCGVDKAGLVAVPHLSSSEPAVSLSGDSRWRCGQPGCGTRSCSGCVGSGPPWRSGWWSGLGGGSCGDSGVWPRTTSPGGWGGSSKAGGCWGFPGPSWSP